MAIHTGLGLNRCRVFTSDQYPIRILEIGNRGALSQKFRIRKHRKRFGCPRSGYLSLGSGQDGFDRFSGAYRQGTFLDHDRVTLGAGSQLTGRGFNPAQVTGLAGANTLGFGRGVHREEHHVGCGNRRFHFSGEVQVLAPAAAYDRRKTWFVDGELGEIRIVLGSDARLIEIYHRDLDVGATIGNHSHGGTAQIPRADAANGAYHRVRVSRKYWMVESSPRSRAIVGCQPNSRWAKSITG